MRFTYHGQQLDGFCHLYNLTWLNERTVELAVAHQFIAGQDDQRAGLEVGNVLGHYAPREHMVVDRYEPAAWYQIGRQWVENCDVFDVAGCWPWIVSISTVEHVGFDTPPFADGASARAIDHLRRQLAPGGTALITFPLGYNPALDALVAAGATGAARWATLVRSSAEEWIETATPTVLPYGSLDRWAASVFIGEFSHLATDAKGD